MSLKFNCKQCGKCCKGVKKLILTAKDIEKIKAFTGREDFFKFREGINYLKLTKEKGCIFLRDNKCSIYPVRPLVCKMYPLQIMLEDRRWVLNRNPCPGWEINQYLEEQGAQINQNPISYSYSINLVNAY